MESKKYWPCNVADHRHVLEATATACIRAGTRRAPNRKWDAGQLEEFAQKRLAGLSEAELAAQAGFSVGYARTLLRHADALRLRFIRKTARWDGQEDPWSWLSIRTYCHVRAEGYDSPQAVRAALLSGHLRDRSGLGKRRSITAELWRWIAWLGPETASRHPSMDMPDLPTAPTTSATRLGDPTP